jgi:hypothetical protein
VFDHLFHQLTIQTLWFSFSPFWPTTEIVYFESFTMCCIFGSRTTFGLTTQQPSPEPSPNADIVPTITSRQSVYEPPHHPSSPRLSSLRKNARLHRLLPNFRFHRSRCIFSHRWIHPKLYANQNGFAESQHDIFNK